MLRDVDDDDDNEENRFLIEIRSIGARKLYMQSIISRQVRIKCEILEFYKNVFFPLQNRLFCIRFLLKLVRSSVMNIILFFFLYLKDEISTVQHCMRTN